VSREDILPPMENIENILKEIKLKLLKAELDQSEIRLNYYQGLMDGILYVLEHYEIHEIMSDDE